MKKQTVFMFFPLFFAFNAFHNPDHQSHRFYSMWDSGPRQSVERSDWRRYQASDSGESRWTDSAAPSETPNEPSYTSEVVSASAGATVTSVETDLPNTGDVQTSTTDAATAPILTPAPIPTTTSSPSGDIFSTGAVTFRFDDGWHSQIDSALPALDAAGIRGTFYIATRQLSDNGFSGFFSTSEVQALAARGQDIGAHTQTHPHLPALSADQERAEIQGSRADLVALGVTPTTISFPYGEYTANSVQSAKDAGFQGAVTTIEMPVGPTSDPYQIASPTIESSHTPAQIQSMIDSAIQSRQWLVLTFHRVDTSGDQYSITPENFQAVVDYVKSRGIRTVTVAEGLSSLR